MVQTVTYRDVYETQLVTKTREEEVTIPGHYRIDVTTIEGFWDVEVVYIEGHYDRQMVWHPEHSVTRYREVPGKYEIQSVWFDEYYVTKYYWREAHPARGLEAAWIPYQDLIPAGYKDTRVWVDAHTEPYQETIPAGERETRVWVAGDYETKKTWVPEQTTSERVWVPPEVTYKTVEFQVPEEVWVGSEPVYEYVDESQVRLFEVLELFEGAGTDPAFEDVITIRNMLTGEELRTTASYVGMATRIDENEYVVPH